MGITTGRTSECKGLVTQGTRGGDGVGFESPPGRFSSPMLDFSLGCNIHTHTTPLYELRPWVECEWGCRAAPFCHATHGVPTAVWELLVAGPCRSSGPSIVGTSRLLGVSEAAWLGRESGKVWLDGN